MNSSPSSPSSSRHTPVLVAVLFVVALACMALLTAIVVRGRAAQDSAARRVATTLAAAAHAPASANADAAERDARRMFEEQVAAVRKTGAPVNVDDLRAAPPIDPADNAAAPLRAAGQHVLGHLTDGFNNLELSTRLSPEQWRVVDQTLADNAPALALVDSVDGSSKADWGVEWRHPLSETLLPHLNELRVLATVLHAAALAAHRDGRDDLAVRRVSQTLRLARLAEDRPFLVTHLVAARIAQVAARCAADLAPELSIETGVAGVTTTRSAGTSSPATTKTSNARPDQVRQLIAALLADRWATDGYRQAAQMERLTFIDCVRELVAGRLSVDRLQSTSGQPADPAAVQQPPAMLYDDARRLMPYLDAEVAAAGTDRLPDYQFRARRVPAEFRDTSLHPLGGLVATYNRAAIAGYQTAADLRLAAAALAARMYRGDHDGRLPATLDDLVPAYLKEVPADPLAAEPGVLVYLPDAADPRVYSVGPNGADDGGRATTAGDATADDDVVRLTAAPSQRPHGPTTRNSS